MAELLLLLLNVLSPLVVAFVISYFTPKPGDWYDALNKPSWTPPKWAFPLVWGVLYLLMGVASYLVCVKGGFSAHPLALSLYIIQLLLNFAWSPLFFGLKRIDLSLVDIVLMWLAVLATVVAFFTVSTAAFWLLLPYLLWVTLALALHLHIYSYNPSAGPSSLSQPLRSA